MNKVLFLADSYVTGNTRYGPYIESVLTYFKSIGCSILIIRTNSFLYTTFTSKCTYLDNYPQMLSEIRAFDPDLVFSINRNGMTGEVVNVCLRPDIPVITWIVDAVDQIDRSVKQFSDRDVVTSFTSGVGNGVCSKNNLLSDLKISPQQLSLFPFFVDTFYFNDQGQPKHTDVSFVASGYDQTLLTNFISRYARAVYSAKIENADHYVSQNLSILVDVYQRHESNYINDLYSEMESNGFDFSVIQNSDPELWSAIQRRHFFQGYFDAHITSTNRSRSIGALTGLKLELYGIPEGTWAAQLCAINIELIRSFNFRLVASYDELSSIYKRSKMALNVQTYCSCGTGFSFRVFDVIACKTLLLTESSTVPAFEHLGFKDQIHYISFKSPEDLTAKAHYFISNENARLQITQAAQEQLEPFLKTCSLQAVLSKNLEDAKMHELASKLRSLAQTKYMATVKQTSSERAIGW